MTVGRGLLRPISKNCIKCTSRRRWFFLYTAALIVLALNLVLSGCGDLSLNQLLENQEPGELGISPKTATLPADSKIELTGTGGFKPYTYENKTSKGTLYTTTGEYIAPSDGEISGNSEEIEIEVADFFGNKATGTFTVYKTLSLSASSDTVTEGSSVTFTPSGGVPDPVDGYYFYIDGTQEGVSSGGWPHTFANEGTYTVEAVDSLSNSAASTVVVFKVGGELMIDLSDNWVLSLGSVSVTAINPSGGHTFSATDGDFDDVNASPTDYNAPDITPDSELVVTITVEDGLSRIATETIHVLSAPPDPLVFPSTLSLEEGEKTSWIIVSGGVPGADGSYTFTLVGNGVLDPLLADRLKYRAPNFPTTEYLWVEDAIGQKRKLTITVEEK